MEKSLLRLFNAVQIDGSDKTYKNSRYVERACKNGFLVDPRIKLNVRLFNTIEQMVGISGEKANNAFHKSWSTIEDTPQETLWVQAMVHYLTTYGFENLGMYSEDTVYIPNEQLDVPEITSDIPLTVVKAMTRNEVIKAIVGLASTGIALSQETLDDIMDIIKANKYHGIFVSEIKNRELKSLLADFYGQVPSDPVDFLRYVLSNICEESLLIKNKYMINKIKESDGKFLDKLMKDAPDDLASIFLRFKPLFLAMKSISSDKTFYNKLRKQANSMHVPVRLSYLDCVTSNIKHGDLNLDKLYSKVEGASIFRKIKLANALNRRLVDGESIVYTVRNGRGWATDFNWDKNLNTTVKSALSVVLNSIVKSVSDKVDGKIVYIPDGTCYAMPATEKKFTGFFPDGSYISVPEDMIVGIHWVNTIGRVDLDLSMISADGKIGWDAVYSNDGCTILFSGDLTDAPGPNGATELFYVKNGNVSPNILNVNYFNFRDDNPIETKIIVAQEKVDKLDRGYVVDPNNILAVSNITITEKQTTLGLMAHVDGENRFYFSNTSVGGGRSMQGGAQSTHIRNHMKTSLENSISLNSILANAGANVVNEKPEDGEFINLEPAALNKSSIIDLIV